MATIHITEHARQRAKERLGLSARAAGRMAERVFASGLRPVDTRGAVRRYLDDMVRDHKTTAIIYGNHVWCFAGRHLITILDVPLPLQKKTRKHHG